MIFSLMVLKSSSLLDIEFVQFSVRFYHYGQQKNPQQMANVIDAHELTELMS